MIFDPSKMPNKIEDNPNFKHEKNGSTTVKVVFSLPLIGDGETWKKKKMNLLLPTNQGTSHHISLPTSTISCIECGHATREQKEAKLVPSSCSLFRRKPIKNYKMICQNTALRIEVPIP